MASKSLNPSSSQWICCQLGAREHYAVPRALERRGALNQLLTDFWLSPRDKFTAIKNGLADRFHQELKDAKVLSRNLACLKFELQSRQRKLDGWDLIQLRNDWFQNFALSELSRKSQHSNGKSPTSLFAYSYAARRIFKYARQHSLATVLGQIDPGPAEERIVAELYEIAGQSHLWRPAPAKYWEDWREECDLAETIIVNSEWSRSALLNEGVPATKITVIPLAFEASEEAINFKRAYPEVFTKTRPLRVLFLGQINLRKGIRELLGAVELLEGTPIEFWFVGPVQIPVPHRMLLDNRIQWVGPVPRRQTGDYYRAADVFVFPTLSDGFGLTQLEAQSWKLPIIASSFCGEVIDPGVNGVILTEVSQESIANALLDQMRHPESLQKMSDKSGVAERFSLHSLSASLLH